MIRRMMLAGSAGSRVLLLLVVLLGWKVAAQQKPVHVERESIRPKTAETWRELGRQSDAVVEITVESTAGEKRSTTATLSQL